jgi:Family of unknown function (DUF6262)
MTSTHTLNRVERACAQLHRNGQQITFTAIAATTGLGRTTLYRNPTLRAVIDHTATTPPPAAPSPDSPTKSPPYAQPWKQSPPEYATTKNNSDASPTRKLTALTGQTPENKAISRIMLRQRRRRIILCDLKKRDVPSSTIRNKGQSTVRGRRIHRNFLQPSAVALTPELPDPSRSPRRPPSPNSSLIRQPQSVMIAGVS